MVHQDRDKRKAHSEDAPLKEERAKRRRGGRRLGSEVAAGSGFTRQRRSRLWSEARAHDLFYRRFSTTWQLTLKLKG